MEVAQHNLWMVLCICTLYCYVHGIDIMLPSSHTDLLALLVLLMGVATASPIPSRNLNWRHPDTSSPRILCVAWNGEKACERFEAPIIREDPTIRSPQNSFSGTIIGSGQLVSEEDRQIHRIMDVKDVSYATDTENPLLIPDVQVVLWFVLLCCLAEGLVSGFRWWRKAGRGQGEDEKSRERQRKGKLESIEESDEDDEENIPVL